LLKVSVIVPVYNPGPNIDECVSSLLGQSMPADEYEVIFVDDGSTDETPARLDELAAGTPNVRVEHTPNSGWPGRPRNIGIDLARGEFLYFVDNDDWIGKRALERLHRAAVNNESDIVIGKVVGHGKVVPRTMFRRSRRQVTLEWPPLLRLLTPHKLFRKSLLEDHGIRFPEGRRRLEDHMFTVHAYFHAQRITVVSDYPCYHWMLRDGDANASWRRFDPVGYFQNVREVLDLVEEHTEPGPLRDQMLAHWYRGKMLGRVGGRPFVNREPEYSRELYDEIRRLALERYGPEIDSFLPFNLRVRSHLLREGDFEALGALAAFESELRAELDLRSAKFQGDRVALELRATVAGEDGPLLFERRGAQWVWRPPEALRSSLENSDLAVEELRKSNLQIVLRSPKDKSEYVIPTRTEVVLVSAGEAGDAKKAVLIVAADVEVATAAAGSRIRAGDWEVRAVVDVAGFAAIEPVTQTRFWAEPEQLVISTTPDGRLAKRRLLRRRLARRFPRLVRLVRRGRGRGDAAATG
jgi:glycosyltransferase involved in cell wall biosynthesis